MSRLLTAVLLLPLGACDLPWAEDDSETEEGPLGVGDGAVSGDSKSQRLTPGEALTLKLKTGARVVVPAGAVEAAIDISFARPDDDEAIEMTEDAWHNWWLASAPYVSLTRASQMSYIILPLRVRARTRPRQQVRAGGSVEHRVRPAESA